MRVQEEVTKLRTEISKLKVIRKMMTQWKIQHQAYSVINVDKIGQIFSRGFQVEISTITKGVPIAKLELRHQRLPFMKTNVQVTCPPFSSRKKKHTQEAKMTVNDALEKLLRQDAAPAQLQAWGQT